MPEPACFLSLPCRRHLDRLVSLPRCALPRSRLRASGRGRRGSSWWAELACMPGLKFREDLPADLPIEDASAELFLEQRQPLEDRAPCMAKALPTGSRGRAGSRLLHVARHRHRAVGAGTWRNKRADDRKHGLRSRPRTGWKERIKSLGIRALFDWAVAGGRAHIAYLHQLGFAPNRIVGSYDVVDNRLFGEGRG